MSGEGGILTLGRRPQKPTGEDLVWLVDGDELPFEDAASAHRPWLEESAAWASAEKEDATPEKSQEPETLIWL